MATNAQITDTVIMVRPDTFGFNPETAASNKFLNTTSGEGSIREKAIREFEDMVKALQDNNIRVITLGSKEGVMTPDAVFPNNWFSTHPDGTLVVYPMHDVSRQIEKQQKFLKSKLTEYGISIKQYIDLSKYEGQGKALEGTGSMVFHHPSRTAFAIKSPRTNPDLFKEVCKMLDYSPTLFHASYEGMPIYHTNVMMNIGEGYVVICSSTITDETERNTILEKLKDFRLEIIDINEEQLTHFCGNILNVKSKEGKVFIVLSSTANNSLTIDQKNSLSKYGEFIVVSIKTIENIGGGSARCMLGEVFY